MPLTDKACRNATCPADKARVRLTDDGGLYLEVSPAASKRWFWKYLFGGKEKRMALGSYPAVSLLDAREARNDARKLHRAGVDPTQQRKLDKLAKQVGAAATYETVAREFHATKKAGWSAEYGRRWLERQAKDMFPWLGAVPLSEITPQVLLQSLRRVEARGVRELAHSLLEGAGQVFKHGIRVGVAERNPASDLREALKPLSTKHMAAVVEPAKAGELMRSIAAYEGQPSTRAALALSAMLFQRPGNIRAMEWGEIDLDAAIWTIPAAKMKRTVDAKLNGRPHLTPLSTQAVALLLDLQPLTGHGRYVFPSLLTGERCMSENTLRTALRRMGYSNDDMTPHGFRAMARTIMVEKLNVNPEVIEAQLAHGKSGPLGMAYDRAEFMEQRRAMMQLWADYLDQLRAGGKVVSMKVA